MPFAGENVDVMVLGNYLATIHSLESILVHFTCLQN